MYVRTFSNPIPLHMAARSFIGRRPVPPTLTARSSAIKTAIDRTPLTSLGWLRCNRQHEREYRACGLPRGRADYANCAAVFLHDALCNPESKAGTVDSFGRKEWFEDLLDTVGRHSRPSVLDGDNDVVCMVANSWRNSPGKASTERASSISMLVEMPFSWISRL